MGKKRRREDNVKETIKKDRKRKRKRGKIEDR
jgi:hypothetical protein